MKCVQCSILGRWDGEGTAMRLQISLKWTKKSRCGEAVFFTLEAQQASIQRRDLNPIGKAWNIICSVDWGLRGSFPAQCPQHCGNRLVTHLDHQREPRRHYPCVKRGTSRRSKQHSEPLSYRNPFYLISWKPQLKECTGHEATAWIESDGRQSRIPWDSQCPALLRWHYPKCQ